MAQGDNVPTLYSYTVGQALYVDGTAGNDTTGDGSSGNPWATLQKAQDYISGTLTWPGSGDVVVYIKSGTYQADSSAQQTLMIQYPTAGKRPTSTKRVVWKPWAGSEGGVIIANPTGSATPKYAIYCEGYNASFPANYQVFEGLILDGGGVAKGPASTNGASCGFYLNGTSNYTTDIQIVGCEIRNFKANASASSAQALLAESGADRLYVVNTKIHDCGSTTGTINQQEHGMYIQCADGWIHNVLVYGIVNGYSLQFYNGDAGSGFKVTQSTFDGGECSGIIVDDSVTNWVLKNSVITNHTARGASSYGIEFYPAGAPGTGNVIDHVVYYNNTGGARSATPSGWTITNETTGDPLYVNAAGGNFTLQAGSPAIGYTDTTYATATDLAGTARPAGAEDAGAYELAAAAAAATGAGWFVAVRRRRRR